ncbi:uncharacterized protein LOC102804713 [Saccoglossus kowalevskii]|uniref:Uncharacterized protein LOC102804713 n=1 Tax=Saccoglossus kowalevskii TaxID=10224 RepID=A0ABM0ML67_SACKO|nr:PREDICTED: uncharacterized protein LOC102804713 [Saccoglossus kowalevskii]
MDLTTCNGRLRELYQDLQSELRKGEVEKIKQLLSDEQLPKGEKESLKGAAEIFEKLEEIGLIKANNLSLLHHLITKIKRRPLIAKYIEPCEKILAELQSKGNDEVDVPSNTGTTSEVRQRNRKTKQHEKKQSQQMNNITPVVPNRVKEIVMLCVVVLVFIFGIGVYTISSSSDSIATSVVESKKEERNEPKLELQSELIPAAGDAEKTSWSSIDTHGTDNVDANKPKKRKSGNYLAEGASSSKSPLDSREAEFKKMLFDLAKEIGVDDLKSLKHLCGNVYGLIPKGDLEKREQANGVFQYLCEDNKISSDNTELLERLLTQIPRKDLVEKFIRPYLSK